MNYTMEAMGSVIREKRIAQGMTQDVLGAGAGYGSGAAVSISRIESGLTRPGRERLQGIAVELGVTLTELEAEAIKRTLEFGSDSDHAAAATASSLGRERINQRVERVQAEIDRRTAMITELGDAFNEAHDRARDQFFMKFVDLAQNVIGAPQPDAGALEDDVSEDPRSQAEFRVQFTTFGVANVLAGGAGGAAAGAAVGGAAAYGTFMAAVSFGTASTGAAVSGLSGVAATNAALALLGGGSLAAGGAGVAGGTAVLVGIVAGPAVLLALGGLVWMVRRNRKQQAELVEKLNAADADIAATRRGVEALADILPRATDILDYVAVHGGHALDKWSNDLGADAVEWRRLRGDSMERYQNFVELAACQLAIVSINVQDLITARGDERERLIELADEVLNKSKFLVESIV